MTTWWQRFWERLNGEEGASMAISFLVHIVLLAVLAIPILNEVREEPVFTTVVPLDEKETVVLSEPIDTELALPDADPGGGEPEMVPIAFDDQIPTLQLNAEAKELSQVPGPASGTGDATVLSGGQMAQPKNAVVAGSFSVWPVPIIGKIGGAPVLGEAGTFPKRYQNYFVAIQIKLPPDQRTYRLTDLSGQLVGTDGWTQRIPAFAYVKGPNNIFLPTRGTRSLKIEDGVVQLFILVPGADAFVKDTINVKSNVLKEEQKLVLTFQPFGGND